MKLSDFNYHLPKSLIAQKPIKPRDHSRLLCLRLRRPATANAGHANYKAKIEHKYFYNIIDYLNKGDVLVLNNSKVFPARLIGKKAETGGKIEVFLLNRTNPPTPPLQRGHFKNPLSKKGGHKGVKFWTCLLGGKGRKENLEVEFAKGLKCKVIKNNSDGTWEVKFNKPGKEMMKIVEKIGQTPLPPYIKRSQKSIKSKVKSDILNYQTIYADENKIGSVAAPTAGFHFTPELLKKIKKKGVQIEFITLHVGLGTFAPVKEENIRKHKMHAEYVEIKKETAQRILQAKKEGRRIIAVGTTSARALESFLKLQITNYKSQINPKPKIKNPKQKNTSYIFWTDIFIYEGYKFKIIDALITNFHLPKSTLLMLVSAFIKDDNPSRQFIPLLTNRSIPPIPPREHLGRSYDGAKKIKKIYQEAIRKKYRFFSYGDAMFIHR